MSEHACGRCCMSWLFLVTPLSKNGVRLGQDGACRERTKSATGRDSRQVQVRLDAGRRVCAACRACGAGALRLACEAPARAAIRRGRRALRCAAALRLHRRPLPGGHALVRHAGLEPRTSRLRATTDSPHATALETGPLLTRASLALGRTPGWEAGRLNQLTDWAVSDQTNRPVICEYKADGAWLWRKWRGTVLS